MSLNDPVGNALSKMHNADKIGKKTCLLNPVSNTLKKILQIFKDNRYIGDFKLLNTEKGGLIEVQLIGAINQCGVIKPRYPVKVSEFEKFEKRYLPAKGFGIIIVSTSQDVTTHDEAIKKGVGGRLLAYVY